MIFEYENKSGKITASLPIDNLIQNYECSASVCMNPFCNCNDVFLELERSGETHKIGINIKERALIDRKNVSVIDEFAKQLFNLLDESDFKILRTIYFRFKQLGSENGDFSKLAVDFPQDEIEQQGRMIIYNELFPYGNSFNITIEGTRYFLLDSYCVKNKCSCTAAILGFYPILNEDADERLEAEVDKQAFSIRVDYQLETWMFEDKLQDTSLNTMRVQSALEGIYNDFYAQLQQRHERLKLLYSKYLKTRQPAKNQKIGRNDACPCGSGKKYKKCCGLSGTLLA